MRPITMDERELIERLRQDDRDAFAAVVEEHQGAVYGYLRARLLQAADAEDLTQEVFLRFYEARRRFDASRRIRPWLMGIARNLLREYIRRVRRTLSREVAWTELCLEVDDLLRQRGEEDPYGEARQHLPGCLENLAPSARRAIDLRYGACMGLAAIGERLRRSEGAIKTLMHRARRALRHCLDGKIRRDSSESP